MDWVELEALDISQLDVPGGKEVLATQVLNFINTNGPSQILRMALSQVLNKTRVLSRERTRLI